MRIKLDDLLCMYNLIDSELNNIRLSCMPDTLVSYFNQLNRLLSIIHAEILKETNGGLKNDKQKK